MYYNFGKNHVLNLSKLFHADIPINDCHTFNIIIFIPFVGGIPNRFFCRRLSNSSDCSAVSSASSFSEVLGPDQQERWTSGYGNLAILPEDQVNMEKSPSVEFSRRTSNDSQYSFSEYLREYSLNQFGDRKSANSNLFLFPRDSEKRCLGFSSEFE